VDDRVAINVLDTSRDALLELLFRSHPYVAQNRAGELGEEALDEVEPGAVKGPKIAPPVYQPRTWRVWTGGFGGVQSFNGDASVGSADARTAVAGGAMGLDYQVDPTRLVGVAVGGSEAHFSVPDRTTSGDVVGGHMGAYGVATWGALYAAGVVSYSRFDNWTTRTIRGVGPTETATGGSRPERLIDEAAGASRSRGNFQSHAPPGPNPSRIDCMAKSALP
jgi:hypothetical protein